MSAQDDHRSLPASDAVARCGGVHPAAVTRCPRGLRCTRPCSHAGAARAGVLWSCWTQRRSIDRLPARPACATDARPPHLSCTPWGAGGVGPRARTARRHAYGEHVPLVCQADNADGVQPIRDGCQLPDHQPLARKTADAVMEQKRVLPPMDLRKKGAQGVHIRGTIETIHRGPLVAARPLPRHTGCDHDKKREQTLREHRRGVGSASLGTYPTSSSSAWCSQCTSSGWRVAQSFEGIMLPFSRT